MDDTAMRYTILLVIFAASLAGCDSGVAKPAKGDTLMQAITDAMCATTRDDLAVALGNVVAAADSEPSDVREGVSDLAWDITPADCQRRAQKPE